MTTVLMVYVIIGVVITIISVLYSFDQYDRNDMITKFGMIAYGLLTWPYWLTKGIIELTKICRKEEA